MTPARRQALLDQIKRVNVRMAKLNEGVELLQDKRFNAVEKLAKLYWKLAPAKPTHCMAGMDGECNGKGCPQNKDGEPEKSGRFCPLPGHKED